MENKLYIHGLFIHGIMLENLGWMWWRSKGLLNLKSQVQYLHQTTIYDAFTLVPIWNEP